MSHPSPRKPYLENARGPNSHSPLPSETPSAIMLGPRTHITISLPPIFGTLKTSSGVGRSSSGSAGRLTPICTLFFCSGAGFVMSVSSSRRVVVLIGPPAANRDRPRAGPPRRVRCRDSDTHCPGAKPGGIIAKICSASRPAGCGRRRGYNRFVSGAPARRGGFMNQSVPLKTGGQILVQCLRVHGVDLAFCVPGESYLPVLDALYDTREELRLIVCRQEGGAAFMAEAYGKLTGRPGICFVTRGPGATNASIGVHTAFQNSTPMIDRKSTRLNSS